MSELPKGWSSPKLGDIVSYRKGKKPLDLYEGNPNNELVPYLDIKALEKGVIRNYAEPSSVNLLDEKSIAIVWDGARSGWVSKGMSGGLGSTIASLTPNNFEVDYLFHFLKSKFEFLNSNTRGTGIPHVDPQILWDIEIPLAPRPEQKRIVSKLDTLFAHLDQLKARLENIPTLLKKFRQAVLTQAVTGKLTEEWRIKNQGLDSKKTIESIKKNRLEILASDKRWSNTKPRDHDLKSTLPNELPKTWTLVRWSEVGLSQNGKSFPSADYSDKGIKLLRPGNLNVSGRIQWTESNTKCLPFEYLKSSADFLIKGNEIIMNLTAQSLKDEFLGRVCITDHNENCLLNQREARILPVGFEVKYCFFLLKSSPFRQFVDQLNTGTLIQHMYTSQLDQFQFAFPPLEEQKEIVRIVESLFAVADRIEASHHILQEKIDHLPQAILSKAFRGELA